MTYLSQNVTELYDHINKFNGGHIGYQNSMVGNFGIPSETYLLRQMKSCVVLSYQNKQTILSDNNNRESAKNVQAAF